MARYVAKTAREILGANGVIEDYSPIRHMANIESVYTYEGTHEMHSLIEHMDETIGTCSLHYSVVTETIFSWPGIGKLIIDSVYILDRPVILAYLVVVVFLFITINLIVDLLYSVIDPRIRLDGDQSSS